MSCLKSILFVCLLVLSVSDAVARRLQQQLAAQQLEAPQVEQLAPVQIGDGSERIITRRSVQMQGGAMKALGTAVLQDLKRKSRFRGSVRDLARQINTDPDLVSLFLRATWLLVHVAWVVVVLRQLPYC
jgi:hypothetical protein